MLTTRYIKLVWIFGILKRVVWGMTLLPFWRLGSFSCHLLEKAGSWTYSKTCLIWQFRNEGWRRNLNREIFEPSLQELTLRERLERSGIPNDQLPRTTSMPHALTCCLAGKSRYVFFLLWYKMEIIATQIGPFGPNFSGKIDQQQPKEINLQSSGSFLVTKIEIWGL